MARKYLIETIVNHFKEKINMKVDGRKIQRIVSDVIAEMEFQDKLNERVSDTRGIILEALTKFLGTRVDGEVETLNERQLFDWLYKIGIMVNKGNIEYILSGAPELGYKNSLSKRAVLFKLPLAYKRLMIIQHKLKNNSIITLDSFVNQLIEENELYRIRNDFLYQTQHWSDKDKRYIRTVFNIDFAETSRWLNEVMRILGIN